MAFHELKEPASAQEKKGVYTKYFYYILFFAFVFCVLGFDYFLYSRTFITKPSVLLIFLCSGLIFIPLLRKWCDRIIKIDNKYLNTAISAVIGGIMGILLFLGANYWGADDSSYVETTVVATDVYIKKYRSNHIRGVRRSYSEAFYMTITNGEGLTKDIRISRKRYNALASRMHLGGQHIPVRLNKGFFGFMIINKISVG